MRKTIFLALCITSVAFVYGCGGGGGGSTAVVTVPETTTGSVEGIIAACAGSCSRINYAEDVIPAGYIPVEGARVQVKNSSLYDTTDSSGYFRINGIEQGSCQIDISLDGFVTRTVELNVLAGASVDVSDEGYTSITLSESGSITVTSTPSGALVFIDDINTGLVTPAALGDVSVGSHVIAASLSGYLDVEPVDVSLEADEAEAVEFVFFEDQPPGVEILSPVSGSDYACGTAIAFSGSAYDAVDGQLSGNSLTWTSSIDSEIGSGESFSYSSLSVGEHIITLVAEDSSGLSSSCTVSISIINNAPEVIIQAPAGNSTYAYGEEIVFEGSASDYEDGVLSGEHLSWTSSIDGELGAGTSLSLQNLSTGNHKITLSAVDSMTAVASDSFYMDIVAPAVKTVLVEGFVHSGCSACAAYYPNMEQLSEDTDRSRMLLVTFRYEESAYWTQDARNRFFSFYDIAGTPSVFADGTFICYGATYQTYEDRVTPFLDSTTGLFIDVASTVNAENVEAVVTVTNYSGAGIEGATLFVAVVENRQLDTYRSIVRDIQSLDLSLSQSQSGVFNFSTDTLIELGAYDLITVAWVQRNSDKKILQAGYH
ncbi:MAG TPA: carboxypeptidase regulatory-like domain-containing protein [bacterium]|nr:carboxypeptidase regulatory-like domain-containing protein [bacterium]